MSPASRAGLREDPLITEVRQRHQETLDNSSYTPLQAPGRCCGGLSTLRGTPPQHLFDVDLLWNDRRDSHYCFKHRSILKSYLESLWVALEGSRAPFWELWGIILEAKIVNFGSLGGPWHLEKTRTEKDFKKEPPRL